MFEGFPAGPVYNLAALILNHILPYFSTKSTEVDVREPSHFSPTDEAAADRPEIVTIYFMKQGTNVKAAEVGPIVLA